MRFALLEQRSAEAIRGLSVAWVHLGLNAKLLFSSVPLRGASVDQPQLQVQPRYFRTLVQRSAEFRFGLRHLPQHKVVFTNGLVTPSGIRLSPTDSTDPPLATHTPATP